MNYELQLTEDHLEAAVTWQGIEEPAYELAHCGQALEMEGVLPLPIMVTSASHLAGQQRPRECWCQPDSAEKMARGLRECFQTAGWQKTIHPDESENLYAQLILLESRTSMGIAHRVGMQENLQQRLLSTK